MTQVPVSKASELFDRINAAVAEGEPNEFLLKSIEREVRALIPTDARAANVLLGVLATHRRDESAMRASFKRALDLGPDNSHTLANYATALSRFGYFEEAYETMVRAYKSDPLDVERLVKAIQFAVEAGAIYAASELNSKLARLDKEPFQSVVDSEAILKRAGVAERAVLEIASAASDVVLKRGYIPENVEWEVIDDTVSVRYVIDAGPDDVAATNREIAQVLCSRFADPLDRAVVFGCKSK
jgi:uncharacterized protein YdhG (YjbR/CyaY superfamily)